MTSPTILPAAIEVAIYHIASEALTNVARHARATRCEVTLRIGSQHADLQIADDGIGLPTTHCTGVGLASMRARAEELGGTFAINNTDPGVCVQVASPVGRPRPMITVLIVDDHPMYRAGLVAALGPATTSTSSRRPTTERPPSPSAMNSDPTSS